MQIFVRALLLSIILAFNILSVNGQRVHIGVQGGLANYSGDLLEKIYPRKITNGHIGFSVYYEISDHLLLRGAYNFARVNGSDALNEKASLKRRNLHFESAVSEFSVAGEFHLFNLYERKFTPYIFAGLAVFHFNPYALDSLHRKIYLKPLSTEGQGLYPDKKEYSLLQPSVPIGGGVKFAITENLRIGFEIGIRKLFTDYLDDVSTSYPDYSDLLAAKGQLAVDYSYRGDEYPGGAATFPTKDTQRGSAAEKDNYYFTGLNITFRPSFGGGGIGRGGFGRKGKFGCPTVPL